VIKRDAVLEVSSPTAQPWIDSNLALVRVEQAADGGQIPMYTFSWNPPVAAQPAKTITAADYSLALAEGGAFHADLILELDVGLQKALTERDPQAWALWKQVRSYAEFYSHPEQEGLQAAADVAVVVDDLDPSDEAMNLMARHNIPFKVLLATNLQSQDMEGVDVIVVFAKPDKELAIELEHLAKQGKTVVVVDAHGSYPWQSQGAVQLNEHTVSYAVGSGKVLELSEPVSDPETFAQDIRRLIGNQNALLSLWNGLTTIAVPYRQNHGGLKMLELINYAQDPVRVQVKVKGSFAAIRYESPENGCCKSFAPSQHDGFTEFVIPDLLVAGRVHLENQPAAASGGKCP
jgi:protein-tyrosine-phosphatase